MSLVLLSLNRKKDVRVLYKQAILTDYDIIPSILIDFTFMGLNLLLMLQK